MKPVIFTAHARKRMVKRGAREEDVIEAIRIEMGETGTFYLSAGIIPDVDTSAWESEIDMRLSCIYGPTRDDIRAIEDTQTQVTNEITEWGRILLVIGSGTCARI